MNIAVSKSTRQFVGYWIPKTKGDTPIIVTAYAVDDLQKKFDKIAKNYVSKTHLEKKMDEYIKHSIEMEENETKLMVQSSNEIAHEKAIKAVKEYQSKML